LGEPGNPRLLLGQHFRQKQNHAELHKFGRLDAERTDAKPAAGPAAHDPDAGDEHDDEQREADDQTDFSVLFPRPVVDVHRHEHRRDAEHGEDELPLQIVEIIAVFVKGEHRAGAVHHHDPDRQNGESGKKNPRIRKRTHFGHRRITSIDGSGKQNEAAVEEAPGSCDGIPR